MSKSSYSRREFLGVSAAVAGGTIGAREVLLAAGPHPV
jgi:hypothetical protein